MCHDFYIDSLQWKREFFYDLSGKTIAPFVTCGGSGFSNTISAIEELAPDAEVADGLSLGSSQASNPGDAVSEWLSSIGLAA